MLPILVKCADPVLSHVNMRGTQKGTMSNILMHTAKQKPDWVDKNYINLSDGTQQRNASRSYNLNLTQ